MVGDNGEPSIYIACAVHSEHLKLIKCQQYARHKKTNKATVLMSTQCKALNNLRANAIHGHCCLRGPVRKSVTPSSGSAAPAPEPILQLSHWLHQVTKQIICTTDLASPGHLTCLFVVCLADICK